MAPAVCPTTARCHEWRRMPHGGRRWRGEQFALPLLLTSRRVRVGSIGKTTPERPNSQELPRIQEFCAGESMATTITSSGARMSRVTSAVAMSLLLLGACTNEPPPVRSLRQRPRVHRSLPARARSSCEASTVHVDSRGAPRARCTSSRRGTRRSRDPARPSHEARTATVAPARSHASGEESRSGSPLDFRRSSTRPVHRIVRHVEIEHDLPRRARRGRHRAGAGRPPRGPR